MKFNFKIQQYQTDAVNAVIDTFNGQNYHSGAKYIRDKGKVSQEQDPIQMALGLDDNHDELDDYGYKNELIQLSNSDLFCNIISVQSMGNIKQDSNVISDIGRCDLDIEMETGTGKTYAYIKTMFELNKRYGWSKFIVIVPSIAIREGVNKSFQITEDHFMEHYGKKARFFIYNSSNLHQIDEFAGSAGINVMIINTQAFTSSLKEGGRSKDSRIIYSKRDEFASRRPIDVIKATNPILILDEPQKMTGKATQGALKNFNPLFTLNYSATHKKKNNLVYVLDALDAYNNKLVKKIEVKGFEVKNFRGTDEYLYLENIILSSKKPPMAKIELEILYKKSINREARILGVGDDLYYVSNEMEQYKEGYTVQGIDPIEGTVTFLNGNVIKMGNVVGDVSEKDIRRIQIRETIQSHFEKEEKLFKMGIKTLSLFFIDEVAKYRQYDETGEEVAGEYARMFEEEYNSVVSEYIRLDGDEAYMKYLREIGTSDTHNGYFSIDKKGHLIDGKAKGKEKFSDDISAYDLILKNKERLLSFQEPIRFIFSHSALREGWDNPNVFQLCTLKHSESTTLKRQEVGRGLRLCVDSSGTRMDKDNLGDAVHDINKLTVIASESYKDFVTDLQKQIKEVLYERPSKASIDYFTNRSITIDGEQVTITAREATAVYQYLVRNAYVDEVDSVTEAYRTDLENNTLAVLPESIKEKSVAVHTLIQGVFDDSVLDSMIEDANKTKIDENELNENFFKKEFQTLWKCINHKYVYTAHFDSNELIRNAIKHINEKMFVSELKYTTAVGQQYEALNKNQTDGGTSFSGPKTKTQKLERASSGDIKYDLVGKIAAGTVLTRRTVVEILKGMEEIKLYMFKRNPEEFISKAIRLINEQKATMIVEHIQYNKTEGEYDASIFTAEKHSHSVEKAFKSTKHIQDYVFTDGLAEKSVEKRFAEDLDGAEEVCVYAKLPKGFAIPTPVGNYSPDWAIAFNEGAVRHIYFIAETKGTMESLQLRPIEQAKISCAKKLFNEISTDNVKYHDVDSYETLMEIVNSDIFDYKKDNVYEYVNEPGNHGYVSNVAEEKSKFGD